MDQEKLRAKMTAFRDMLKPLVAEAAQVKKEVIGAGHFDGEVPANITLALRHLEDAATRFGKAIQAADTGKSPLGGPDTPQS